MNWTPISESQIWDYINDSYDRMSIVQRNIWEAIKIIPEKWKQEPYGNEGNGFWVVAIYGTQVMWFNDIEDGFNSSTYKKYGEIEEYYCNQDQLEWQIQNVIDIMRDGYGSAGYCGAPQPIA